MPAEPPVLLTRADARRAQTLTPGAERARVVVLSTAGAGGGAA